MRFPTSPLLPRAAGRPVYAPRRIWRWLAIGVLGGGLALAALGEANPFERATPAVPHGQIDELVFARLRKQGLEPALDCSDAVFVRRAFLDTIGLVPTMAEVRAFLDDKNPAKRAALIDALLARDEFADFWAMKWADLLRVKAEFPINLWPNAAQAYHRWIHAALHDHKPYDAFARELLTANGSNFRVPAVNFYRAVQSKDPRTFARTVALNFMGTRAEKWAPERLAGMAAFFSQVGFKATREWKEEIVFWNPAKAVEPGLGAAVFPDGTPAVLPADRDPREVFAQWLTRPENPWFARAYANRVWSWLVGRGIVEEPDDLRPDNAPSNPALLDYLERELIAARFDTQHLFRLILNSATYQLSCVPRSEGPAAAAGFASYPLRRLDAEVLIDALNQITGTGERYVSAIPEPYTQIPEAVRAVELCDGSITSPFLEMFGRSPRDSGLEAERSRRPSAAQRLTLLNSSQVRTKLENGPRMQELLRTGAGRPRQVVDSLYLTILARYPTEAERKIVLDRQAVPGANGRTVAMDLAWALINSAEFLHRH